ncbi:kelch-like protein diablo [Actinia tenebrosa]|uniref:Kelch-like protein diablo n=1 Tax=Actinia tenebrosa TaxID=6105 RepID=A0A6P8J9K6_ACTTE|nr:kelch-like protein diablo [Actinia tenebrosa]
MDAEVTNFQKEIKEKYLSQLLANANQMRKSGSLCDVILRVKSKDFPAHRSVLASASLYFRGLFMSQMKEDQMFVEYNDLDSRWIEKILSFIYTGDISLTEENAADIVAIADYLIIPSLKELGTLFLQKRITHCNCFSLHVFGDKFSCKDLSVKSKEYINQNFETLCFTDGFKALDVHFVMEFFKSDEVQISKEEVIFEAIQEWIYHDLENRKQHFEKLFGCVRLLCISKYYLADYVESESLVKESDYCTNMLFKVFKSFVFSYHERRDGAPDFNVELGLPRKCLKKEEVSIVVTGGTYLTIQANKNTEAFLPSKGQWMKLTEMNYPRDEHVTVTCGDFLYAIGGYKNTHTVERYDPRINTWTEVASLPVKCSSAAAVTIDGRIYVIGGRDSFQPYNTVQCYDPEDNTWCLKAPMNVRRKAHSAVVLDGYIFAIGGMNDTYGQLGGVESYDPGQDHWRHETTMCTRRNFACATTINRKIYVIGGYEAEDMSPLSSCEVFDPDTGTWTVIPDMHVRRAAAGIATINGKIYIIGGVSEHGARADVECYDTEKQKWEVVFSMPAARAYIQCNVIKLPKRLISKLTISS